MAKAGGADGFDPSSVRGFVTRAQDTVHLNTPQGVYDGLRLDYPGTHFDPTAAEVHVIRFEPSHEAVAVPRNADMGGGYSDSPPFTGNGFTRSPDVEPEFHVPATSAVGVQDGAEIWSVADTGNQRLVAVLREGSWVPGGSW